MAASPICILMCLPEGGPQNSYYNPSPTTHKHTRTRSVCKQTHTALQKPWRRVHCETCSRHLVNAHINAHTLTNAPGETHSCKYVGRTLIANHRSVLKKQKKRKYSTVTHTQSLQMSTKKSFRHSHACVDDAINMATHTMCKLCMCIAFPNQEHTGTHTHIIRLCWILKKVICFATKVLPKNI